MAPAVGDPASRRASSHRPPRDPTPPAAIRRGPNRRERYGGSSPEERGHHGTTPRTTAAGSGRRRRRPTASSHVTTSARLASLSPLSEAQNLGRRHRHAVGPNFAKRKVCHPKLTLREDLGRSAESAESAVRRTLLLYLSVRAQPRPPGRALLQVVGVVSSFQRRKRGQSKRAAGVLPMQPRDNKRARLLPSATLGTLDDDLLIRCASYLNANGLAQLGRTSARFGISQSVQQRSLVNETARQRFLQIATDEERSRLPKYDDESDIGLYRALALSRLSLCFDALVGYGFSPQEHPASVRHRGRGVWSTAMSGHVMRGGRHFVEFAIANHVQSGQNICLGVIRPVSLTNSIDLEADWEGTVNPLNVSSSFKPAVAIKLRNQRTAKWRGRDSNVHCCAYYCGNGRCIWTDWHTHWNDVGRHSDWQGSESLEGSGTVGLLLDLGEGTLSVFKNGRHLGVMKDGLSGEYCWFVTAYKAGISVSRGRAPN